MEALMIVLFLVVMFIGFKYYGTSSNVSRKTYASVDEVNVLLEELKLFFCSISMLKENYITKPLGDKLSSDHHQLYKKSNDVKFLVIKNAQIQGFIDIYSDLKNNIKKWNESYITRELSKNKLLFDNIDGKKLDDQQRRAVVVDEINNLVLAGAGSGKTLTISGKVKYLVEKKNIRPNEILLMSFTKKAAEEMYERISQKLMIDVQVKTFHKLGLDIIKRVAEKPIDTVEKGFMSSIIDNYFDEILQNDPSQILNIVTFLGCYLNIPKDLEKFDTLGDCIDYNRNLDFETIKGKLEKKDGLKNHTNELNINKQTLQGETVKSYEEVLIANFLFLNGINYEYERVYPFESPDKYKKKYKPDFYLSDYDLYLEHFGVNREFKVPWLTPIEEEKYVDGITWKRGFHRQNETKLLETYSFYNAQGILLSKLESILKKEKVEFKKVDYTKIYEQIYIKTGDKYFKELKKLINTFIGLFKSNGFQLEKFEELSQKMNKTKNDFMIERNRIFISMVKPIYIKYQEALMSSGKIDFNDMINLATDMVKEDKINLKYKYIIIDEYQDISVSRLKLIKEIKNKTKAKLMCVGDDWQSIYRFTGSDIDLFINFEQHFGFCELLKIEKTYRNSQELINIAGKFVMKNDKQFKKDLKSHKHHSNPLRIVGYDTDKGNAIKKSIEEIVYKFGSDAEITLLGRNNFDIDFLEKINGFKIIKNTSQVNIKCSLYPKLRIKFLTVHRSKGLEADNIIVINLENKLLGFPNKISDDPILSLVLTDVDPFDYAEERRLFYVAITRTKNSTYLITPDKNQSIFVQELIKDFDLKYEMSENSIRNNPTCPLCQKGYLVVRDSPDKKNKFLGCTNYPICDSTFNKIEIMDNSIKCTSCGGYMIKRPGRHGEFYGCTNYPYCNNTMKVEAIDNKPNNKAINLELQFTNKYKTWSEEINSLCVDLEEPEENVYTQTIVEQEKEEIYLQTFEEQAAYFKRSENNEYAQILKQKTMGDTVVTIPDKNLLGVIKDIDRISNVEPSKELINFDNLYLDDKQNYIDNITSLNELHEQAKKLAVSNVWGIDAIALNKKILEIDNKNSLSYTRLAKCYTECGKVDEAKQLYEEVLTFDKNNTIAKNRLDQIELDQRNMQAQLDKRDNSNIYRK